MKCIYTFVKKINKNEIQSEQIKLCGKAGQMWQ